MENSNVKNRNYDADLFLTRLKEVSGHKYQKDIAADLVLNESKLSKKITGETKWSCDELLQISSKYKCSIDYLLGLDVTRPASNEPEPPFKYPMYARTISNCFCSGIYIPDDTLMDDIELHNDVARYIFSSIRTMYKNLTDGNITTDIYNTWLDGLCNDFNYIVYSPESIEIDLGKVATDSITQVSFPNFVAWLQMKKHEDIKDLSTRDLYKHYARQLEKIGLQNDKFKLSLDDDSNGLMELLEL